MARCERGRLSPWSANVRNHLSYVYPSCLMHLPLYPKLQTEPEARATVFCVGKFVRARLHSFAHRIWKNRAARLPTKFRYRGVSANPLQATLCGTSLELFSYRGTRPDSSFSTTS